MPAPGSGNRRLGAAGQEVAGLHLGERVPERREDELEVGVGVRGREEPAAPLPDVHAAVAHHRVEEPGMGNVRSGS